MGGGGAAGGREESGGGGGGWVAICLLSWGKTYHGGGVFFLINYIQDLKRG